MRKGEKGILLGIIVFLGVLFVWKLNHQSEGSQEADRGIPFYSDAGEALQKAGYGLYKKYACKECHTLWSIRSYMQSVPSPAMDGIGSIRSEAWLYDYLSTEDPQTVLPSRLKKKYQMPSYASLSEEERRTLAAYLASLKVEDWYLEETKKSEYEKLTGKDYSQK